MFKASRGSLPRGGPILLTSIALTIAVIALPVAGMASGKQVGYAGGVAANTQTFTDPSGDSGSGPDVTTIVVSNDDAGTLTFVITFPNRTALMSGDIGAVNLDTDQNAGTGDFRGYEYSVVFSPNTGLFVVAAVGPTTYAFPTLPSFSGSYSNGQATFSVNRADIGSPSGLSFNVTTGPRGSFDRAPDAGLYSYQIVIATPPPSPPTLTAGTVQLTSARAGKPFTASMVVTDADTGAPVKGKVTCTGKLAGKVLRASRQSSSSSGKASCTWSLPKSAHGKRFRGSISESFRGSKVSRSFSTTVK